MSYFDQLPKIDRDCITAIVEDALARGFTVSVYDGEGFALKRSADKAAILAALCSTDEDKLVFRQPGEPNAFGWAYLVYGNEPGVVVSDYTTDERTESIVARSNAMAMAFDD